MKPCVEFLAQGFIYHPLGLNTALASEGLRHNFYVEMGFARIPCAGMASMRMGFIDHLQVRRVKIGTKAHLYSILSACQFLPLFAYRSIIAL